MKDNTNLTYRQLITLIVEFNKRYPQFDILDQPATFADPQDINSYYNVGVRLENDGHLTLE